MAINVAEALAAGQITIDGDSNHVTLLLEAVGPVDPDFPIVTPRAALR